MLYSANKVDSGVEFGCPEGPTERLFMVGIVARKSLSPTPMQN
jgi:hypothetical protein